MGLIGFFHINVRVPYYNTLDMTLAPERRGTVPVPQHLQYRKYQNIGERPAAAARCQNTECCQEATIKSETGPVTLRVFTST